LLLELPVSDEISSALTGGTGRLGFLLELARACEAADDDRINRLWPGPIDDVKQRYHDAARWAAAMRAQITAQSASNVAANRAACESMLAHAGA
jgi:c-di-GMP-related signal transduction protein